MAGLLAWAADVVGGSGGGGLSDEEFGGSAGIELLFTSQQQESARELEQRASSLRRSIEQLRQRLPPPDISQRLPHLHAHSLASNAALALQLNAHSATKQEVQSREASLREENVAYEKAIFVGQKQIQEKLQEATLMEGTLKEMDLVEKHLRAEMEKTQATSETRYNGETLDDATGTKETFVDGVPSKNLMLEELEKKKKDLISLEEIVQNLEKKRALLEHDSIRQPSPAQREKILEKQLQSLMEQLAAKQAQAEGLATEIHAKELELENFNGLKRRLENGIIETTNTARNRVGRSGWGMPSSVSADYVHNDSNSVGTQRRTSTMAARSGNQQKFVLLRSVFVLYILILHLLVFIKISFSKPGRRS